MEWGRRFLDGFGMVCVYFSEEFMREGGPRNEGGVMHMVGGWEFWICNG